MISERGEQQQVIGQLKQRVHDLEREVAALTVRLTECEQMILGMTETGRFFSGPGAGVDPRPSRTFARPVPGESPRSEADLVAVADGKVGCPETVWDGPYSSRCSMGKTKCAQHGEFDTRAPGCIHADGMASGPVPPRQTLPVHAGPCWDNCTRPEHAFAPATPRTADLPRRKPGKTLYDLLARAVEGEGS